MKARRDDLLDMVDRRVRYLHDQVSKLRIACEQQEPERDSRGDLADRAFARARIDIERELIDRHLAEIGQLERARERVAADLGAVCVECGSDIGWQRLRAMPSAQCCIECQSAREKAAPGTLHAIRGR